MKKITREHIWTEEDETIAYFCEKFGTHGLSIPNEEELAINAIGTSKASLTMKRANFKHLMGGEGFEHYSANQVRVYERYATTNREDLLVIVNKIINNKDLSENKKDYNKKVKAKNDDKARREALIKMGYNPDKMRKIA